MKNLFVFLGILIFTSCSRNQNQVQTEVWKQEIREAERAFDSLSQVAGIQQAFVTFAAEDVTVLRNNNLIHGKSALKDYFISNTKAENVSLTWKPDFVDVSSSGDLGYTYGKYVYTATDSVGNTQTSEGFFHTVWKRQPDGTWKFIWD
jgi:ketosteroid isomerase-like protein